MAEVHVVNLREVAREVYRYKVRTAHGEYRRALTSIKEVQRLHMTRVQGAPLPASPERGELARLVRRAVESIQGQFTAGDVLRVLGSDCPTERGTVSRASVATAIRRLAEHGRATVVQQGRGRQPTVYVRTSARRSG